MGSLEMTLSNSGRVGQGIRKFVNQLEEMDAILTGVILCIHSHLYPTSLATGCANPMRLALNFLWLHKQSLLIVFVSCVNVRKRDEAPIMKYDGIFAVLPYHLRVVRN
jgi:hypothetical protein